MFGVQHLFTQRVLVLHRDEGLGDLLGHSRLQLLMRGKAAVAVPWARPEDAEGFLDRLALLAQHFEGPSTHGARIVGAFEHEIDHGSFIGERTRLAILGKRAGGQIPLRIEPLLFQEVIGQQSRLRRAATAEGHAPALQVFQCGDARVAAGEELGGEVDVDITHGHDPAGVVQTLFDVDVRDGTIPGQVDFSGRKRLDEGVVAGVQDPIEFDALPLEMRLQTFKHRHMPE